MGQDEIKDQATLDQIDSAELAQKINCRQMFNTALISYWKSWRNKANAYCDEMKSIGEQK